MLLRCRWQVYYCDMSWGKTSRDDIQSRDTLRDAMSGSGQPVYDTSSVFETEIISFWLS